MNFDEMSLEERVARWPKPWLRQGLEHERKLLRRQVALRFGAQTAERTAEASRSIFWDQVPTNSLIYMKSRRK